VDGTEGLALARLERDGVKVLERPHRIPGGKLNSAFIEGPDKVEIELVEGNATRE
jgi:hypothetical protein